LVVINLDVLKYRRFYLPLAMPPLQNLRFPFERLEKALRTGVVPAVPLPGFLPELTARSTADSLNALVYSLRSPMITSPWVYHGLNCLPTVPGEVHFAVLGSSALSFFVSLAVEFLKSKIAILYSSPIDLAGYLTVNLKI
jgi:hypothetical protein